MAEEIKNYLDHTGLKSYDLKIKKYIDKKDAELLVASEINVIKKEVAEEGYLATYEITQNGEKVGASINVPKDFLVKSAELKTVTVKDVPYEGAKVGEKYIDFIINAKEGESEESHVYLPINDLVDVYRADENTLHLDPETNTFSVKEIAIEKVTGLQDALDAKDTALNAEVTRAKAAEEANATAIEEEAARAAGVEAKLEAKFNDISEEIDDLAPIAKTGNVMDLEQDEEDILILQCN